MNKKETNNNNNNNEPVRQSASSLNHHVECGVELLVEAFQTKKKEGAMKQ